MSMDYVYHYTSLSALYSILKGSIGNEALTFCASDITMMNDPDELAYGISKAKEYLVKLEKKKRLPKDKRLSHLIKHYLVSDNKQLELTRDITTLYAISFSEDGDNLPMWRSYGDECKGVCIKICDSEYKVNTKQNGIYDVKIEDRLHASKMEYGDIKEDSSVARFIKEYLEEYLKDASDEEKQYNSLAFIQLFGGMFVKRPEFKYEREHRLYKNTGKERHYRLNTKGRLIPYIKIPINKDLIKSITLGPAFDNVNKVPLMRLICDAGLGKISFANSAIHFRNI